MVKVGYSEIAEKHLHVVRHYANNLRMVNFIIIFLTLGAFFGFIYSYSDAVTTGRLTLVNELTSKIFFGLAISSLFLIFFRDLIKKKGLSSVDFLREFVEIKKLGLEPDIQVEINVALRDFARSEQFPFLEGTTGQIFIILADIVLIIYFIDPTIVLRIFKILD